MCIRDRGSIKTVIKNFDDYLLKPLGEALFSFNMQFDFDPEIQGDLEIRARGVESLMANEVKSQRLLQFLQVVANPTLAPFAKFPTIIREIADSIGLDPDKVANTPEEAARMAKILQQQQADMPPPPPEAAPGLSPADQQGGGGGTIGIGTAPPPEAMGGQPPPPQGAPPTAPAAPPRPANIQQV